MKTIKLAIISFLLVFALTACDSGDIVNTSDNADSAAGQTDASDTSAADPAAPASTATDPDSSAEGSETAPDITVPDDPDTQPSADQGTVNGLTISEILSKAVNDLVESTGFDVSMTSVLDTTSEGVSQKEEQNVHIQLNAAADGYSYAVEAEIKNVLDDLNYTQTVYQAYKDGWLYQSIGDDLLGSMEETTAKIAITREELTDLELDPEVILALNSMADLGTVNLEDMNLEEVFESVEYVELENGHAKIVCSKMRLEQFFNALVGLLGDEISSEEELSSIEETVSAIAQMFECDLELGITENGAPESFSISVSVEMTDPEPVSVRAEYAITINALGEDAGKVTLPEDVDQYPVYESFEDYMMGIIGDSAEA